MLSSLSARGPVKLYMDNVTYKDQRRVFEMTEKEFIHKLKKNVVTAYRILYKLGLCDYAGDVSARIPGTDNILIGAKGIYGGGFVNPSSMDIKNIITVNLMGKQLEGDLPPPLETPMHTSIYKVRSDVGGIAHTHPIIATAFSIAGKEILPIFARGVESVSLGIPIFENSSAIDTEELGQVLAETLGQHRACLLQAHGLVTVGRTVEEACIAASNLEQNAKIQLITSLIGNPRPMSDESIKNRIKVWSDLRLIKGVWSYYESIVW